MLEKLLKVFNFYSLDKNYYLKVMKDNKNYSQCLKAIANDILEDIKNNNMDWFVNEILNGRRTIKSLEKRNDIIEDSLRKDLQDAKKQQTNIFISMGMAVFTAILSLIINLFQ